MRHRADQTFERTAGRSNARIRSGVEQAMDHIHPTCRQARRPSSTNLSLYTSVEKKVEFFQPATPRSRKQCSGIGVVLLVDLGTGIEHSFDIGGRARPHGCNQWSRFT